MFENNDFIWDCRMDSNLAFGKNQKILDVKYKPEDTKANLSHYSPPDSLFSHCTLPFTVL